MSIAQSFACEVPSGFDRDPMKSRTLPGHYYYDPAVYEVEKRKVFYNSWQYVGHVSMLPGPGTYITREILDQSVMLIRDRDREIRAFFNVCQHRAHRLLEGEGRLASACITCPYHAWTYDFTGRLRTARGMEKSLDFDIATCSLAQVRLGQFLGFLFVNLDGKAPPFQEVTGGIAEEVAKFSPKAAEFFCADRSEYVLKANWKNSVENYSECLHCPTRHRSLVEGALDYPSYRITVHPHHHSHRSRDKGTDQGYRSRTEAATNPQEFGSWLLWPNWSLEVYPGGPLNIFHHVPAGPEKTVHRCEWCLKNEKPTAEEREIIDFVHEVRLEDIPLCESVQAGFHSLGYGQGRFVVDAERTEISEHAVHDFQMKLLDSLSGRL